MGEFARDLPAIMMGGNILMAAGKNRVLLYGALEGGSGELTEHYDRQVDRYMAMPHEEMEKYPEYNQAEREGKSEEQARFRTDEDGDSEPVWQARRA